MLSKIPGDLAQGRTGLPCDPRRGPKLPELAGGSIEKLKEILGHYSVVMTERYAHIRPELFSARDLATICLDRIAREPEPPCKPGAFYFRCVSASAGTGRDKFAETLEALRPAATECATEATA